MRRLAPELLLLLPAAAALRRLQMHGGEKLAGSGKDAAAADVDANGSAPFCDVVDWADVVDALAATGNGDATRFDSDLMGDCSRLALPVGAAIVSGSLVKLTFRFTGVCCSWMG